ncbi:MAG: flagellar basal body P-ring formation protein FlgA [Rhodobacteraceae bacterium]|nr:flagellar basal body P-ring formation protein FlgA [Paracoccaceae bacterium]
MTRLAIAIAVLAAPSQAKADFVTTTKMVRPEAIITAADIVLGEEDVAGAFSSLAQVVGLEARVALYPGRPIRPGDIGPPALINRNDLVTLVFRKNGLEIETMGRSLGRAGAGEFVRALNVGSKSTVTGQVTESGRVLVGNE